MFKVVIGLWMVCACVSVSWASSLAVWIAQEETEMLARIEREPAEERKAWLELMLRKRFDEKVKLRIEKLARADAFDSEQLQALRAKRAALIQQLKALDEEIFLAGYETPEVKAQLATLTENANRVNELQMLLSPKPSSDSTGGDEAKPQENKE